VGVVRALVGDRCGGRGAAVFVGVDVGEDHDVTLETLEAAETRGAEGRDGKS